MNKKQEKIFVLAAASATVIIFVFAPWQGSYFGLLFGSIIGPNWDELSPHDIVKNDIPLTLLAKSDGSCKMFAENLGNVIDHQYFVRGMEFARDVKFDPKNSTIVIPCEISDQDKSRLHVWYIKAESAKDGGDYKYFITPWNDTTP